MSRWRWLGIVLVAGLSGPVASQETVCELQPSSQRFEWTRHLQGVSEPVVWTVTRELAFTDARAEGVVRGVETYRLDFPRLGQVFQRHLDSAVVDECDVRFDIMARTVTAQDRAIRLPLVVRYDRTACRKSGRRGDRLEDSVAEIDVSFAVDFVLSGLVPEVTPSQSLVYGELSTELPARLFQQVLEGGATTLETILGSLSSISVAGLAPDVEPVRLTGGFIDGPTRFDLTAIYRFTPRQACRAMHAVESFGTNHRSPGSP